jgi:hypothetical protein
MMVILPDPVDMGTLSFRPEGDFAGTPGQEQFFIE